MSDSPLVDRILDQVVDRQPIDWDALTPSVHASEGTSAEHLAQLAMLRLLDHIGQAHSTFQEEGAPPRRGSGPAADEILVAWGRYRLDDKVGSGGFGSVYRGWDPVLEMPVAIKILHRHLDDEALTERLIREGRTLAQVRHPNVVRVMNVEQHDGRTGLVMEFLRGDTLEGIVVMQGPLNDREATLIAEDVGRALAAVHAVPLVHRDIKARNVIRERAGRVVLMDFGAGLAEGQSAPTAGTPLYMAPELLRSMPAAASAASDVYSVGVLLFYLVTGRYPVEGASIEQIRRAHQQQRQQSLLSLRPDLPLPFVQVVERALAHAPEARFHTAAALLQALAAVRDAGSNWRRRATITVAAVAAVTVLIMFGGMLSSAAFNLTLGRSLYAQEGAAEWFALGRRSLLLPIVLSLLAAGLVGLLLAARKVAVSISSWARGMDRVFLSGCGGAARRLSLHEPSVCAGWLLLATAVGAVTVWAYWRPLLEAVTSNISTVPADVLAVLSPPFLEYRANYRVVMSLLVAVNIAAAYALVKTAAWRGTKLPGWFFGAEIATLVLLFGAMQIPYRIMHDSDEFPVVVWGTQRCHVLGERATDVLLFCPGMMPRQHVVTLGANRLPRVYGEGLFASFAPSVPH